MGCKPVGERYTNSCVRQHPGTADGVNIEFLEYELWVSRPEMS